MQTSSKRSAAIKPEQFPISCVCKSLYSDKKCSTSEKIRHLGCVNFDLTRATSKEEYHLFLHISKRKDCDVNTKASSAVLLVAGWLENDHIKLSCYPMMDPDGIVLLNAGDTSKGKVGASSVPLEVQNLASFNSNGASVLSLPEKCQLWLSGSADANSPIQGHKKLRRSSCGSKCRNKRKVMEPSGQSTVKRNGKRLLRLKRISRQHSAKFGSKCHEIHDIKFSDSYPNPSEVQVDTNHSSIEPVILDDAVQLPWEYSEDEEEFLDFNDTGDEFETHSCVEEFDELFADIPVQEEKCCDVNNLDLQPVTETMSTTLNSCGIAVIDRLDELLTKVVPSSSKTTSKCQSRGDPPESDMGERCQIQTSKLSASQPTSNKVKNGSTLSTQTSGTESLLSQSSSLAYPFGGRETPYLLKRCKPHTDLSIQVCMINTAGTSGSDTAHEEILHRATHNQPSVEIPINRCLDKELSKDLCSKKSDHPMIKTCITPANSSSGSRLGPANSSAKLSVALCPSENSFDVGRDKLRSVPSIPAIPGDAWSKISKTTVIAPCSGKASRGQIYRGIKSDLRFENVSHSRSSKLSNFKQPNGPNLEQATDLYPKITTSISNSKCLKATKGKQSNLKLITSETLPSFQVPFTTNSNVPNARVYHNSKEQATSSGKSSVSNVTERHNRETKKHDSPQNIAVSKSVGETSQQIPCHVVVQTASALETQKVCDCNTESSPKLIPVLKDTSIRKVKVRTYDPLGPSNGLVWNRRVRKVFRKFRVVRLLAKPKNM